VTEAPGVMMQILVWGCFFILVTAPVVVTFMMWMQIS
jgi:hypothetical protein